MIKKTNNIGSVFDALFSSNETKNYRKELSERDPEFKQEKVAEKRNDSYLNDVEIPSNKSCMSSKCNPQTGVNDTNSKSIYSQDKNKNSIWNSEKIEKLSEALSNKEKTIIEKESNYHIRNVKQSEYNNIQNPQEDVENIGIPRSHTKESSKNWTSPHNISMFDDKPFENMNDRVPEMKKESKKDNSWEKMDKNKSIKDNDLSIFSASKESLGRKNSHKNSINSVFDSLNKEKNK